MSGARGPRPPGERAYALLLGLYPSAFREEYGAEMVQAYRAGRAEPRHAGAAGALRFWARLAGDVARSAPRAWLDARRAAGPASPDRPPYAAATLAALAVWALYALTLSPTVAFWDAGEYITVAHVMGIAHAPGNPLFVMLARAWELLLAPTGLAPAVRINLFSATLSAAAHGLWFLIAYRALAGWSERRGVRLAGAAAAVALSATAFTVWNQSNVSEKVYTVSLFTTALVTWLAFRWRDGARSPRLLVLIAYLLVLSATNHLMGLLAAPAVLVFVWATDRRALLRPGVWTAGVAAAVIAVSAQFFLPIRAELRPLVSENEPTCESATGAVASVYSWGGAGCEALSAVLSREQYGKSSALLDPTVYPSVERPRGAALLASQLVNWLQYLDWQWARSVGGRDPLFGGARPVLTLFFVLLGLLGARTHWRSDRAGALYVGTLFATLSLGLVLYLNFKYGYSIANDRFPEREMHEVRERDYFFIVGFGVWGVWAGVGLAALWRRAAGWLRGAVAWPELAAAPVLGLALLPLALNWPWATRADDYSARDWAYNVLMSVEPYGVLVTNGDNDSFPLWYLQKVEGVRKDVTIVLSPYLNTPWYLKQLRELTRPCPPGVSASDDPTRVVCQRAFERGEIPAPLAAYLPARVAPPEDSIVPLSDEEIDRIAQSYFVAREPLSFRAAGLEATIRPGTPMFPADTFVAAILQATLGERPIHFMTPSSHVEKLGLAAHTVRQGLTWRLSERPLPAQGEGGIVRVPEASPVAAVAGAYVDLPRTDTLLNEVFLHRGRVADAGAPWVDHATFSIPLQYAYAHFAAAQGHALLGNDAAAQRHVRRGEEWAQITTE